MLATAQQSGAYFVGIIKPRALYDMKRIPSDETVLQLLDRLHEVHVDELESEVLDFKRWEGAKKSLSEAVEAAVCFANAEGGLTVFGVKDRVKGRANAVTGCERYDPLDSATCFRPIVLAHPSLN